MARFDLVEYLLPRISRARVKNSEIVGCCPLHGDSSPSFSVNIKSGAWLCRSASCGKRGSSIVSLIAKIERCSYKQAAKIAQVREPLYSEEDFEDLISARPSAPKEAKYAPVPLSIPATDEWPHYLIERRYLPDSGAEVWQPSFGLRGCPTYRNRFEDYLILPVFDGGGNYLSFTARYTGFVANKLRYDGPSDSLKNYLYGEWLLSREDKPVFVVEGQFDAWRFRTFGEDALGTFGTSYTYAQVRRLCDLVGDRPLVICYDKGTIAHDLLGADAHSVPHKLVSMLQSLGKRCQVFDVGLVPGVKDIDDLDFSRWCLLKASLRSD